jgi:hypothetical protein
MQGFFHEFFTIRARSMIQRKHLEILCFFIFREALFEISLLYDLGTGLHRKEIRVDGTGFRALDPPPVPDRLLGVFSRARRGGQSIVPVISDARPATSSRPNGNYNNLGALDLDACPSKAEGVDAPAVGCGSHQRLMVESRSERCSSVQYRSAMKVRRAAAFKDGPLSVAMAPAALFFIKSL